MSATTRPTLLQQQEICASPLNDSSTGISDRTVLDLLAAGYFRRTVET